MSEALKLAKRFREPLIEGRWVAGTNLKELLSQVSYEEATTSIGGLNSVAALTFHLDYYIAGVVQVFEGGNLEIRDKHSFDMPEIRSAQDWQNLQQKLWQDTENFATAVARISEDQLSEVFVDEKYGDYRRNIEGMIEHAYYHLGQVRIIMKLMKAGHEDH